MSSTGKASTGKHHPSSASLPLRICPWLFLVAATWLSGLGAFTAGTSEAFQNSQGSEKLSEAPPSLTQTGAGGLCSGCGRRTVLGTSGPEQDLQQKGACFHDSFPSSSPASWKVASTFKERSKQRLLLYRHFVNSVAL